MPLSHAHTQHVYTCQAMAPPTAGKHETHTKKINLKNKKSKGSSPWGQRVGRYSPVTEEGDVSALITFKHSYDILLENDIWQKMMAQSCVALRSLWKTL